MKWATKETATIRYFNRVNNVSEKLNKMKMHDFLPL